MELKYAKIYYPIILSLTLRVITLQIVNTEISPVHMLLGEIFHYRISKVSNENSTQTKCIHERIADKQLNIIQHYLVMMFNLMVSYIESFSLSSM